MWRGGAGGDCIFGIAYLAQWDFSDETTGAAFVNGEVYDQLPAGQWDRNFEANGYMSLVTSPVCSTVPRP